MSIFRRTTLLLEEASASRIKRGATDSLVKESGAYMMHLIILVAIKDNGSRGGGN